MNKRIAGFVLGLCIAGGFLVTVHGQGMYWETARSGGTMGDEAEIDRMYYMPRMFKMEAGSGEEAVIIRLDKQVMYNLDVKNKTYSEMTFDELENMSKKAGAKLDEAMSQMQKQMEGMPEEQRKMVEEMMKGKMQGKAGKPPKADVAKTEETRTISGYPCTKYVVKEGEGEMVTLWVTKEVKGFESMRKDMEELQKRMAALDPRGAEGMAAAMATIDGFPIRTEMPGGMSEVVTKIERRSTRDDAFEIPTGYKKVNSPMMPDEKLETPETE